MSLFYNPTSIQAASLLQRRPMSEAQKQEALSKALQEQMANDPRSSQIQDWRDRSMTPFGVGAGLTGVAAQLASALVAKGQEKKLAGEYQGRQAKQNEMYAKLLNPQPGGASPLDSMTPAQRQIIEPMLADPDMREQAAAFLTKQAFEPAAQPKYEKVGNDLVRITPDNKVEKAYSAPEELPTSVQEYNYGKTDSGYNDWTLRQKKASAANTSVTVNAPGQKDAKWGEAPNGYTFLRDPNNGEVLTDPDPRGGVRPRIAPMVGSKDDAEAQTVAKKEALAKRNRFNQSNIVLRTIDDAKKKLGKTTTGLGGAILSNVPGTKAYDLSKDLETIKANAAFDELQKMRAASPTGGALGAVERSEMLLLQSTIASVEQAQSEPELREALDRHAEVYDAVINGGPDEAMQVFNKSAGKTGSKNTNDPLGLRQ